MTRTKLIAIGLVVLLVVAWGTVPAAANHRTGGNSAAEEVLDDVSDLADENASSGLARAQAAVANGLAFAGGIVDRVLSLGGPDTTASAACDDLRQTVNQHNSSIQEYVNIRTNASTAADVLQVTCEIDGERSTIYITADVNGNNYENASAVNSTTRAIDESCTLESDAAANASAEVDRIVETYVIPGEKIPRTERRRLAGRYLGDVTCSFL